MRVRGYFYSVQASAGDEVLPLLGPRIPYICPFYGPLARLAERPG